MVKVNAYPSGISKPVIVILIVMGAMLTVTSLDKHSALTGKVIGAICGSVISSCDQEAGEVCVLRGKENAECEIPPDCYDTDGGRQVGFYGQTTGINYTDTLGPARSRTWKDGCGVMRNGDKGVTEWYCDGPWAKVDFIPCPLGTLCIRGACRRG